MIRNNKTRESVRLLRSKGRTYSEILKSLSISIPKSTLSDWCKKVIMPLWYENRVKEMNAANLTIAQKRARIGNEIKNNNIIENLKIKNKKIPQILKNRYILRMLLSILHLGEGAKWKSHRGLMLGSSSSDIIILYIKLLNLCYGISLDKLKCRISYRADQDLKSLEKYWSNVTGISLKNFYKSKPDPRTIGKKTRYSEYKGVCVIMCGGTIIQKELELIPLLILKGL